MPVRLAQPRQHRIGQHCAEVRPLLGIEIGLDQFCLDHRQRAIVQPDHVDPGIERGLGKRQHGHHRFGRGAVGLHFTALGRTRRVTWFDVDSEAAAHAANQIPLSGKDFDPEPGSAAARRARPALAVAAPVRVRIQPAGRPSGSVSAATVETPGLGRR